jgi:hypothetical protein
MKTTYGYLSLKKVVAAALGVLFLGSPLSAETPPRGWKREAVPGQWRCLVPADWRRQKPVFEPDRGPIYTDGICRIKVARYDATGPGPANPQEFLDESIALGYPFKPADALKVSGRPAQRWTRWREVRLHPRDGGGTEMIYDEVVFLPDPNGFWALSFNSPHRAVHTNEPRGLEVWQRFLESFELTASSSGG